MTTTPRAALFLALALSSACGQVDALRGKRKGKDDTSRVALGELGAQVAKIQAKTKQLGACDAQFKGQIQQLAAELDARKDALDAVAQAQPPSKLYHRVALGPIAVRELNEPFVPQPGWLEDRYGWDQIIKYYQKIAATPVDANWLSLNEYVRSILVDDESRVIYEANMALVRTDYPLLADAQKAIDACVADAACVAPAYSADAAALIDRIPVYKERSRPDRDYLASLKEWVDYDLKAKSFTRNPSLALAATGELAVELDAGPFADVIPQLEAYVTSVWKNDAHQLKVSWVSQADHPNAFKFVVETGLGGRSYVQYSTRSVHLFADVRAPSIAHEIGHVLGFPDYYYTSFDPGTCLYTNAYSEEDLMSTSEGKVTADEWKELETILGAPPSA